MRLDEGRTRGHGVTDQGTRGQGTRGQGTRGHIFAFNIASPRFCYFHEAHSLFPTRRRRARRRGVIAINQILNAKM